MMGRRAGYVDVIERVLRAKLSGGGGDGASGVPLFLFVRSFERERDRPNRLAVQSPPKLEGKGRPFRACKQLVQFLPAAENFAMLGADLLVTDSFNHRCARYQDGTFAYSWGKSGTDKGDFNRPIGIATDAKGAAYVSDTMNNRIEKFDLPPVTK